MTDLELCDDIDPPSPTVRPPGRRVAPRWSPVVFPLAVLVVAMALGGLKITTSSLSIYGSEVGREPRAAGALTGPARGIRSDEWYVRTPWALRQATLGLPTTVEGGVGKHDVAVLSDLPTRTWVVVLRPTTIPYLLLGPERAFATEWWLYHTVQLIGVYALLWAVTRRIFIAALCAVLVTASPATQWWVAPGTFTTTGYGCLATGLLILAVRSTSFRRRLGWSAGAGLALAAFLTTLYVPWQVGTVLVVAPIGITVLAGHVVATDAERRRDVVTQLLVIGGVAGVIAIGLFGTFVFMHRSAFESIASTVYPGKQPANRGGGASLRVFWGAAFDYFASKKPFAIVNDTNQSENASALVLILPVAMVTFALSAAAPLRRDRRLLPLVGVLAGGATLAAWMLLPIPAAIGRWALLTRATPGRLFLPLGLASVLSLGLLAAALADGARRVPTRVIVVASATLAAFELWDAAQYTVDGGPIPLRLAMFFVLIVASGTALAFTTRPEMGLAILAAFTLWQASLINPVQQGATALTASPLHTAIDDVEAGRPAGAGWVGFGIDAVVRGTLTAAGVNNLSGTSPYPDTRAWEVIDPTRKSEDVWNRYAHVTFMAGPVGSEPKFELMSPDSLTLTIDPCSPALASLHVELFVTENSELGACARPLRRVPHGKGYVQIYERISSSS